MSNLSLILQKGQIYAKLNEFMLKTLNRHIKGPFAARTTEEATQGFQPEFDDLVRQLTGTISDELSDIHGPAAFIQFKNEVSRYALYFPALLRLFFQKDLAHEELWDDLIRDPYTYKKNYFIPAPLIYQHAKDVLFHPTRTLFEYRLQTTAQELTRAYPKTALTATSMLLALNPSLISISLGLFTGLTLCFKKPKAQRTIGPLIFQNLKMMALFWLLSGMLFPLVLKALVNENIPLPITDLLEFAGLLTLQFLMELRTAWNCAQFEQGNTPSINASYPRLKQQVLRETFSPLRAPALGALAVSASLFLPSESLILKGIFMLAPIVSGATHLDLILKKKATVNEFIQLILLGYSGSSRLLQFLSPPPCLEIQRDYFFGVRFLSFPNPAAEIPPVCHESSGLTWGVEREGSSIVRIFTADSLRHRDQLVFAPVVSNSTAGSLIPWRGAGAPVETFCNLTAPELCRDSYVTHFRGIVPGSTLMAFNEKGPFPEVITTQEQLDNIQKLPLPLFLAHRAYQAMTPRKPKPAQEPTQSSE